MHSSYSGNLAKMDGHYEFIISYVIGLVHVVSLLFQWRQFLDNWTAPRRRASRPLVDATSTKIIQITESEYH